MRIHEAICARSAEEPYITREKWTNVFGFPAPVKVVPTDSPDGCIVLSVADNRRFCRWQPTLDDLVADDWNPVW